MFRASFGRVPLAVSLGSLAILSGTLRADDSRVEVVATPDGGIQPQAVADAQGTIHLIYFKGEPGNGDLFYIRRETTGRSSPPLRVNSQPGSAIATGTIRGGQIALGRGGRVHVAWNGSGKAEPKNPAGGSPILYARLNDAGGAFEAQRNVMQVSNVIDGGGTVAADQAGNVYVAWHAIRAEGPRGEDNRQVWVARSSDDGKTFAPEVQANDRPTGACGCCGMRGFVDSKGAPYFVYRAATRRVDRDMTLLFSRDAGKSFESTVLGKWKINDCPMSSESFAEGPEGVYVAWETAGQVFFARVNPTRPGDPVFPPGVGKDRKHPALAANAAGDVLLAWAEGTGWQRGGTLSWQLFDKDGKPAGDRGRLADGIPVWGLPTAVAGQDRKFTIFH
ncbi:MAG: sialidase family protein [Gemmataceae bacterium]